MPTFFSPGGRTFAGGDMMPCVIPWPHAGGLRTHAANAVTAISLEILDLIALLTATFLSITSAIAASSETTCRWCPNAAAA